MLLNIEKSFELISLFNLSFNINKLLENHSTYVGEDIAKAISQKLGFGNCHLLLFNSTQVFGTLIVKLVSSFERSPSTTAVSSQQEKRKNKLIIITKTLINLFFIFNK